MANDPEIKTIEKHSQSAGVLELLFTLALLTACAYPMVYMYRASTPHSRQSQTKYTAVLLAHHIMESIIARKAADPTYVPDMTDSEQVVQNSGAVLPVSRFFQDVGDNGASIGENDSSQLFRTLNQYNCNIDTYYLEGNIYKVIVYVTYQLEGYQMSVFLERLLPQIDWPSDGEDGE